MGETGRDKTESPEGEEKWAQLSTALEQNPSTVCCPDRPLLVLVTGPPRVLRALRKQPGGNMQS